jgi:hypothetical protein
MSLFPDRRQAAPRLKYSFTAMGRRINLKIVITEGLIFLCYRQKTGPWQYDWVMSVGQRRADFASEGINGIGNRCWSHKRLETFTINDINRSVK